MIAEIEWFWSLRPISFLHTERDSRRTTAFHSMTDRSRHYVSPFVLACLYSVRRRR